MCSKWITQQPFYCNVVERDSCSVTFLISRAVDFYRGLSLEITLPEIEGEWCENVGERIIKKIEFGMNNSIIPRQKTTINRDGEKIFETITENSNYVFRELCINENKREGFMKMINPKNRIISLPLHVSFDHSLTQQFLASAITPYIQLFLRVSLRELSELTTSKISGEAIVNCLGHGIITSGGARTQLAKNAGFITYGRSLCEMMNQPLKPVLSFPLQGHVKALAIFFKSKNEIVSPTAIFEENGEARLILPNQDVSLHIDSSRITSWNSSNSCGDKILLFSFVDNVNKNCNDGGELLTKPTECSIILPKKKKDFEKEITVVVVGIFNTYYKYLKGDITTI